MLYLLDANVLIAANGQHYPFGRIPHFWEWVALEAKAGHAKIPFEIYSEINSTNEPFMRWLSEYKDDLILDENVGRNELNQVQENAYRCGRKEPLSEEEIEKIKNDSILIAYAFSNREERVVVTKEASNPDRKHSKTKIPNACKKMGIRFVNDFQFYFRERDFHIPYH